jgi:hypothetical protein
MAHLLRHWHVFLALAFAVGEGRVAFYYLIYEPLVNQRREDIGVEFEQIRPLLKNIQRVGYLSDEPLDNDPTRPRVHDKGDMMYARAQYALAPAVLVHSGRLPAVVFATFDSSAALDRILASDRYRVISRISPTVALLRYK